MEEGSPISRDKDHDEEEAPVGKLHQLPEVAGDEINRAGAFEGRAHNEHRRNREGRGITENHQEAVQIGQFRAAGEHTDKEQGSKDRQGGEVRRNTLPNKADDREGEQRKDKIDFPGHAV